MCTRLATLVMLWLFQTWTVACAEAPAAPTQPDDATSRAAERLAVTLCSTCHGPRGDSASSRFPKIAGQQEAYLANTLLQFKNERRADPDARAYMWGVTAALDEDMIAALAKYFARQPGMSGTPAPGELAGKGQDLFEHGVPEQSVAPCASCHGSDAHGNGTFPRLAGQYADYLVKQISAFRNQMRDVPIMHAETNPLTQDQIRALAAFLQSK